MAKAENSPTDIAVGLAFIILFPWLLSYLFGRKSKQITSNSKPKAAKTQFDYIVSLILLSSAIISIHHGVYNSPLNLMEELDIGGDVPSFVVRNKFRNYMVERYEGWTEQSRLDHFSEPLVQEIRLLESLAEKLKSKTNRIHYMHFGHDAFLLCDWCKGDTGDSFGGLDYFLYILPSLLFTYSLFFAILGVVTATDRKSNWRLYGTIVICITASIDLYYILLENDKGDTKDILSNGNMNDKPPFILAFSIRYVVFGILCFLIWLIDANNSSKWSNEDMLLMARTNLQNCYSRTVITRFAKSTIFGDDRLRAEWLQHNQTSENLKALERKSSEYKELREKYQKEHGENELISNVRAFCEKLKHLSVTNGYIDGER